MDTKPETAITFSPRQMQILERLAVGKSAGEIAKELFRSKKTVDNQLEQIYKKLRHLLSKSNRVTVALWCQKNLEAVRQFNGK